jgi:hypothetical protein
MVCGTWLKIRCEVEVDCAPGIGNPSPLRGEKRIKEPSSTGYASAGCAAPLLHPWLQPGAPMGRLGQITLAGFAADPWRAALG